MATDNQGQQDDIASASSASTAAADDWITVGRIVAAQGMAGEVRVYPESDFPDRFLVAGDRWLRYPGKVEPEPIKLKKGRYIPKKNLYIVKFEGVNYRDQSEALRDAELLVPASDRPELDDGEFHVMDLVGLEVFLQETGESIGRVVDLISVGNDLLEIELPMPIAGTEQAASEAAAATAEPTEAPAEAPTEAELKKQEKAAFTRRKGRRKAARERKKAARPKKAPRLLVPFVHDIVPLVDLEAGRIEITPPPGLLDLSK